MHVFTDHLTSSDEKTPAPEICHWTSIRMCLKYSLSSKHGGRRTRFAACRACLASETLRQYTGPTCFAIPGNHDWIDGLETFQRHIHHKGWLGGWLLPQVRPLLSCSCASIGGCEQTLIRFCSPKREPRVLEELWLHDKLVSLSIFQVFAMQIC